jgi:hypothetical protein
MKFSTMRFAFFVSSVLQLGMTLEITAHCVSPIAIYMAFACSALVFYLALQTENDAFYARLATHVYAMHTTAKVIAYSVDPCGHALFPLGVLRIACALLETCFACEFFFRIWFDVYLRSAPSDSAEMIEKVE